MVVSATASDIPIYDPATSGQIIDPAKLGASYAKAAASFDAVEEIEAFHKEQLTCYGNVVHYMIV